MSFQFGIPTDGSLQLKSKPEAFEAPQFINTGKFPATAAQLVGIEVYRRTGSWLYGTEYYLERATSPQTNNPVFNGGDVFVTWVMTGETRAYVAPGSVFTDVSPRKSGIRRRHRRGRVGASVLEHRPDCRYAGGRNVLAGYAGVELVPVGQRAARVRVRLWLAHVASGRRARRSSSNPGCS